MVSKVITTHVCQVRSSKVHVMYFLQAYGVYIYIYVCVYLCPHILANRSSLQKNGAWSVCLWDLLVEDSGYNCLHLRQWQAHIRVLMIHIFWKKNCQWLIFTLEKPRPCTNRIVTANAAAIISITKRTNQTCTGIDSAPSSQDVVNKTCTAQPRSTPPGLAQAYDAHKPRQTYLHVSLPLFRLLSITDYCFSTVPGNSQHDLH